MTNAANVFRHTVGLRRIGGGPVFWPTPGPHFACDAIYPDHRLRHKMRRYSVLLVVAITGMAFASSDASACARVVQPHHDCCPGEQIPLGGAPAHGGLAPCTACGVLQSTASQLRRDESRRVHAGEPPSSVSVPLPIATDSNTDAQHIVLSTFRPPPLDLAHTYLYTLRLRL